MERSQVLSQASSARTRQSLIVELTGLHNRKGVVNVALFASANGFPSDPNQAIRSGSFPIDAIPFEIELPALPCGRYAITVHHDENMDGQLNCNALGIPKEGIGFSGNPQIWRGVPAFQKAAFDLTPDHNFISITMKYLLR
ncbi:MAG TPA: DUF2141 domain-containing protein [Trichocoleus sp.]